MAKRREVVDFLNLFKSCVMLDRFAVRDRQKNIQGLIDLGLTPSDRREVLLALVPEDYCSGPMPDDEDGDKEVWVFGKVTGDTTVYIKLRVTPAPGRHQMYYALVWSFHPSAHRMKYPLKAGKESGHE